MREIKFRGKTFGGDLIFGDLIHCPNDKVSISDGFEQRFVLPESVAQLIGYDANGKEIYSDDKVIEQFFPEQFPMKRIAGDRIPANRFGEKFDCYKLEK